MATLTERLLKPEQALELYDELLQRNDAPEEGDDDLLQRVLTTLSKTPAQFTYDVNALTEAAALVDSIEENQAAFADLREEVAKNCLRFDGEITGARRTLANLERERSHENGRVRPLMNELTNAERELYAIKRANLELFRRIPMNVKPAKGDSTVTPDPDDAARHAANLKLMGESVTREKSTAPGQSFGPEPSTIREMGYRGA